MARVNVLVDGIIYAEQRFGGINTYFNEILPRIARRPESRVDLLVPEKALGQTPGPPVHTVRRELIGPSLGGQRFSAAATKVLNKIDSVLLRARIQMRRKCVFHSTYLTCIGGRHPSVASVYDLNHEVFPYDNDFGRWVRKRYPEYLGQVDRIIAISHNTKHDLVRFYGLDPSRIDVIHLAANRTDFWPDHSVEHARWIATVTGQETPYVLYVGSRDRMYKNFDSLIAALAQSRVKDELRLVVAGDRLDEWESDQIERLGLQSRLQVVIRPTIAQLRGLYSHSQAFIYPSRYEGFGIPLLEAMACGTMVLAADTSVFREVAGDAAQFFSPTDHEDIGRALEACLDPANRAASVARGFRQVDSYSWDRCADATWSVYDRAWAGN